MPEPKIRDALRTTALEPMNAHEPAAIVATPSAARKRPDCIRPMCWMTTLAIDTRSESRARPTTNIRRRAWPSARAPSERRALRAVVPFVALIVALASLQACASSPTDTRWSRHFEAGVWGGSLEAQLQKPDRYVPELALAVAVPFAFVYDDDIQAYESKHTADSGTQTVANALQVILPAIPLTVGTIDWARGDGGKNFEATAETLGGVVLIQQVLANTVNRERPNLKDTTSFPSGHASWAFAATTLIVRNLHDPSDTSFHAVDALLYLPAIFGAWERVAIDKHWSSDAVCGALLGVLWANFVWDAHFGGQDEKRSTIFVDERRRGVAWSPCIQLIDDRVTFGVRGGF